ncbi:MAG: hypothetical protein LBC18_13165 [Opitutaceae bacterium]|nr:hypothetical protein [Opitutaceae bacterium]
MPKPVTNMMSQTITSVSREHRIFRPSAEFQRQANLGSLSAYKKLCGESVNSPEKFFCFLFLVLRSSFPSSFSSSFALFPLPLSLSLSPRPGLTKEERERERGKRARKE